MTHLWPAASEAKGQTLKSPRGGTSSAHRSFRVTALAAPASRPARSAPRSSCLLVNACWKRDSPDRAAGQLASSRAHGACAKTPGEANRRADSARRRASGWSGPLCAARCSVRSRRATPDCGNKERAALPAPRGTAQKRSLRPGATTPGRAATHAQHTPLSSVERRGLSSSRPATKVQTKTAPAFSCRPPRGPDLLRAELWAGARS